MSAANVFPSAPPAPQSETQNLYPNLPVSEQQFSTTEDKNFRLEKVNEIASTLSQEVTHYRLVGKKYKRANKVVKSQEALAASMLSLPVQVLARR